MELLHTFFYNTASFIVIMSVIVFIHEFGHYYIAKISGVKIETFSIGFGREIFGWNDKSGTRWKISLLPMGGYVKMFGDVNPASAPDTDKINAFTESEKKIAFHTKPLSIKAAIVAAGPIANFVLAIVIMAFMFNHYGKPTTLSQVSAVSENSAASEAGILPGDVITQMDSEKVDSFADIQRIISLNTGTPVAISLKRHEEVINVVAIPKFSEREDLFGNKIKSPMLGIASNEISYQKLGIGESIGEAFTETYHISAGTLKAIGQMILGQRSAKEISGPIGIAKYSGQSFDKGAATVFWFMVVLSINLGLINLFPIPVLDGGHLMYYAIEALRGKPMADKIQQYGFKIGIALVLTLAIFAIFNDIRNLNMF
jgi:regulator of sigma E protease